MYSHIPPDIAGGKAMQSFYDYIQTDEIRKVFGEELVEKALKLTVGAMRMNCVNRRNVE
jgi:hypothetical protein